MKFKITDPKTYTIEADSIEEAAEKYAELITANLSIEVATNDKIDAWDKITDLKNRAECYCIRNLDTLLDMLGGGIETTKDEISNYGNFVITECQKNINELCHYIDLFEKAEE